MQKTHEKQVQSLGQEDSLAVFLPGKLHGQRILVGYSPWGHNGHDWMAEHAHSIYTMEYYWAIKNNTFESVLFRWMKLEPLIQGEVRQKGKHQNTNIVYSHIYMEFRKTVTMALYVRQKKRHRCIQQSFGLWGRRWEWDDLREWHWNMYIIICETDRQSRFDAWDRVLRAGALGWPWGMGWGFRMGNTCTPMADSYQCMAKTTTIS